MLHGGPGFDLNFYLGVVQIIGSAVGLGAAAFYAFVVAGFDTRTALLGAVTFRIATGIFDLVIAQRWNRVYLGVDDKAFFVMGDAVASSAAGMLAMLPIKTLASRVIAGGGPQQSTLSSTATCSWGRGSAGSSEWVS